MIKVGIIGGAGYTAGELIRIILYHPSAKLVYIHSSSNAGNPVWEVHHDLQGETELVFSGGAYQLDGLDVLFLCMGHGKSVEFMEQTHLPTGLKVVDLSHDFRLKREGNSFVYGLPELNREAIKKAQFVANPGCFATGIQLALLPLAAAHLIVDDVHVNAITGSTGAGQQPSSTSHFSWRESNLSVYKVFSHQHLGEINQSLNQLQSGYSPMLNFVPVRGNHTRGIFTTAYTRFEGSLEEAQKLYADFYDGHPFVCIAHDNPDMKRVVNTNKCFLHIEKHGQKIFIVSLIDNLIKGASGQAVQNMNLMYDLDEKEGLGLKPVAF